MCPISYSDGGNSMLFFQVEEARITNKSENLTKDLKTTINFRFIVCELNITDRIILC